jgi:hypothetical protein
VAQLVEALRYKPEGRGLNSRWCQWNFSFTQSFRPHYGSGDDSASNRKEYEEYFLGCKGDRCVGLTTLPPSYVEYYEIWEPQPPGTLRTCPGLYRDCFTILLLFSSDIITGSNSSNTGLVSGSSSNYSSGSVVVVVVVIVVEVLVLRIVTLLVVLVLLLVLYH